MKSILLLCLGLLLLCPAAPAPAAGGAAPVWNLALVVEQSAAMSGPWLETSRLAALEKALQVELTTLPLSSRAGLWLSFPGGAQALVPPRPARELKDLLLVMPREGAGRADLGPGVAAAAAWLRSRGGGSLLVISSGRKPELDPGVLRDLAQSRPPIFCHVLVLSSRAEHPLLERLALAGGGALLRVASLRRLGPMLHRAVLTALTPGRLLLLAHDSQNRPREVVFQLRRQKRRARTRPARSNRLLQLMPGVYGLTAPAGADLGPGPVPRRVRVNPRGISRYWIGGWGKLAIKAQDAQGRPLYWRLSVARLGDGRVVVPLTRSPLQERLPAGFYTIKSDHPRRSWMVELAAGQDLRLVVGPPARLTLALAGPRGPVRVPYQVRNLLAGRPAGTGYTGSPLGLAPGRYRLQVEVPPGLVREVALAPGEHKRLELPPVGEVYLKPPGQGPPRRYQVRDARGRLVATGISGRGLLLWPGSYRLRLEGQKQDRDFAVQARRVTTLSLPGPGPR